MCTGLREAGKTDVYWPSEEFSVDECWDGEVSLQRSFESVPWFTTETFLLHHALNSAFDWYNCKISFMRIIHSKRVISESWKYRSHIEHLDSSQTSAPTGIHPQPLAKCRAACGL